MNRRKRSVLAVSLVGLLAVGESAYATFQLSPDMDLDARRRAVIAKHRAKQAAATSSSSNATNDQNGGECGSQNIGNVNTVGRPGQGPREIVIVGEFTNVVTGKCR
jgi:hypothetical protein